MENPARLATIFFLGLGLDAFAGTTVVDSIHQETPPGSVGSEQILIIENDQFGNQRVLSIGHPGGTVTGPRPCSRDEPLAGMDCTGEDLRNAQWDGARLSGSQFDGADLRGASLNGAQLENTTFNGARLDKADLSGTRLVNCDFNGASLTEVRLNNAGIINADFMGADLTGTDMTDARLVNVEFMGARLEGAKWTNGRSCGQGSVGTCRR